MQTLVALLFVTAAACAIAGPGSTLPDATAAQKPVDEPSPPLPPPAYVNPYYMFPLLNYRGYEESLRLPAPKMSNTDWLNKEIDRINQMEEAEDALTPYEADLSQWISQDPYIRRIFEVPATKNKISDLAPETLSANIENLKMLEPMPYTAVDKPVPASIEGLKETKTSVTTDNHNPPNNVSDDQEKEFALTPSDKGYFEFDGEAENEEVLETSNNPPEGSELRADPIIEPPRQIRQNPNLSRTKTLVAENLDRLRAGLSNEDGEPTVNTQDYRVTETASADDDDKYSVSFIAVILAAVTVSVIALLVGWYTLSKKAKAAADIDYPAYGVTGPTIDSSGDRKLAHCAHMYHYQHQKQQIIAMERNGLEQRNGSISDPESEEENEEGDYTVYECPGFATTGDMEVKNPLYSEDPTPATPGKCDVVKPQPKE